MLGRVPAFQAEGSIFSSIWCRPTAFAGTWDRMIYAGLGADRYKADMELGPVATPSARKSAPTLHLPARDTFTAQTPLVVIGLAALGMIFLINSHARPTPTREKAMVYSCAECGQVTSVRTAPNSDAPFIVEVQMLDGSLRAIPQSASTLHVGDIVRVNGQSLTLRSGPS